MARWIAEKGINGRKRRAMVGADRRALPLEPYPACIQDRYGGGPLLSASRALYPFIARVFADGGYNHERVANTTNIVVKIVRTISARSVS